MDLGLSGKVALVAASSKGLGKASALAMAGEGAKLAICARNEDELETAAAEMRDAGAEEVLAVPTDLTNKDSIDTLVKRVHDHYGRVDILFTNNGGPPAGMFWEFDEQDWDAAIELTLMSAIRLIQGVLPGMRERNWGRIICSTSIATVQPTNWAHLVLSNAVRAGVHGLAKTLAFNVAGEGITVNCLVPGPIHTDRIDQLAHNAAERQTISFDEALAGIGAGTAMKRVGQLGEFGPAAAFLASDQASFITGISLRVDGGEYGALL